MASRKISVVIAGDAASLDKALGKASASTTRFANVTSKAHGRLTSSLKGIVKTAGSAALAYASIAGAKKAINTTEELAKTTIGLHKNFGLSIKSASEWAAIAKTRGVDGKQLSMGFKTLSTQARNAAQGMDTQRTAVNALKLKQSQALALAVADGKSTKDLTRLKLVQSQALDAVTSKANPQAKIFKSLGISQQDLVKHGSNLNSMLHLVSDGLAKLPAGTDKAAIMSKLFGRSWQNIAPLIRGGSKAMDEQLAVAQKYGASFGGKSLKSVEDMVAAQREAKLASIGLSITFGTIVIPVITKIITGFARLVSNIRTGAGTFGTIGRAASTAFNAVKSAFNTARAAVTTWASQNKAQITQVISAFRNIGTGIRAAIGVIAPIVKSAIGPLAGIIRGQLQIVSGVVKVFASVFTGDIGGAFKGLLGIIKGVISTILGAFQLFLNGLAKVVGAVAKLPGVGKAFKGLASTVQAAADKVGALRAQIDNLHDKTITITTKINGPSGKVSGGKGHKVAQGASADGPGGGPYFETEASIANAQAYQEALQAKFQAADDARQERSLQGALRRAQKAKKGITDAKRALQDFQRQLGQARALSTIDVKVKGLQAVKAFKDSLTAVRGQLKDLAQQAADVWRGKAEAAIAGGPLAQQLAGLQAQDAAADDAATRAQNAQDLADAVASGDVAAQKKANDAIAAYDRQVQEKTIQDQIDAQIAGLDVQEANYKTTLDNQLGALADNLQNGKIMYATFASEVNAILAQYGLNYNGSPDEEAAINAHPAGAPKAKAKKPKKKRAMGGPVAKGTAYWVGERGPETFVPNQSGQIIPAGGGGGGGNVYIQTAHIGSKLSARILANKLAHQLAH